MYLLAELYRAGVGVPISREQAKRYFLRSAQLGFLPGFRGLALLLQDEAMRIGDIDGETLLRFAAEHGDTSSQLRLAEMYRDGDWGMTPNPEQARSWYRKVLENGKATESARTQAQTALQELDSPRSGLSPIETP
jgi:hypothetical protein